MAICNTTELAKSFSVVAQEQGVPPSMKTFCAEDFVPFLFGGVPGFLPWVPLSDHVAIVRPSRWMPHIWGGSWTLGRSSSPVAQNCLEVRAVFLALQHFLPDLRGYHVLVRTTHSGLLYKAQAFTSPVQAGAGDPADLGGLQTALPECSLHPWAPEFGKSCGRG